jgi:hypothetical protein
MIAIISMTSLREKFASVEAENNVLRQQALKARHDNVPALNMHRKSVTSPSLPPLSLSLTLLCSCTCSYASECNCAEFG